MRTLFAVLTVSLVVSMGDVQAQAPTPEPIPVPVYTQPYGPPMGYGTQDCESTGVRNGYGTCGDAQMPPKTGLLARWKNKIERHGCGYGKTHHDMGCMSLRSNCVFVFGNCQQFFEEPCFKQPESRHFQRR